MNKVYHHWCQWDQILAHTMWSEGALPLIWGNQSFVAGIYHHCKIAICLAKLWKTTHNVKHGSSVRINHSIPHVSFIQGIQNVDQTWVKLHLVQTTLNTIYELVTRNCMNINIPVRKCINYIVLKSSFWPYLLLFGHILQYLPIL